MYEGYYRRPKKITDVRDGDSIVLDLPLFSDVAIRLSGVDTPENNTGIGREVEAFIRSLLIEKTRIEDVLVYLEPAKDRDGDGAIDLVEIFKTASFDRWPGTIFVNGIDVRSILLNRRGYAILKPRYRNEYNEHLFAQFGAAV